MEQNEKKRNMQHCQPMNTCIPQEMEIRNVRLAAAYVPYQCFCTLLSPLEALVNGTAFPELVSPYEGRNKKCMPMAMMEEERSI